MCTRSARAVSSDTKRGKGRAYFFRCVVLTLKAYPVRRSVGAQSVEFPFAVDEALQVRRQERPDRNADVEVMVTPSTQQHQVREAVESEVWLQQALRDVGGQQDRVGARDNVCDVHAVEAAEPALVVFADPNERFGAVGDTAVGEDGCGTSVRVRVRVQSDVVGDGRR